MKPSRKNKPLTFGEYFSADRKRSGQEAGARQVLMTAARRVYPRLFKRLLEQVYPKFDSFVKGGGDLAPRWKERVIRSGGSNQLTYSLLAWAEEFNIDSRESWILQWALDTLEQWYRSDKVRKKLVPATFAAGAWWEIISDEERFFEFQDDGWQLLEKKWLDCRRQLEERFQMALKDYERRMRGLADSRGLLREQSQYSQKNFDWLVQYEFNGLSSIQIAKGSPGGAADPSTILKGCKAAAELVGWKHRRPHSGARVGHIHKPT
jgi:hypothetical protein